LEVFQHLIYLFCPFPDRHIKRQLHYILRKDYVVVDDIAQQTGQTCTLGLDEYERLPLEGGWHKEEIESLHEFIHIGTLAQENDLVIDAQRLSLHPRLLHQTTYTYQHKFRIWIYLKISGKHIDYERMVLLILEASDVAYDTSRRGNSEPLTQTISLRLIVGKRRVSMPFLMMTAGASP
jgi:hypothetical protein